MYRDPRDAERARIEALEQELAHAHARIAQHEASTRRDARAVARHRIVVPATVAAPERPLRETILYVALAGAGLVIASAWAVTSTLSPSSADRPEQRWPAVVWSGVVTEASPAAPAQVGDKCTFALRTAESAGQHGWLRNNCHGLVECEGRPLYGAHDGFFPCKIQNGVPLQGGDTMLSSVDGDASLVFDASQSDLRLEDDEFMMRVKLAMYAARSQTSHDP